MKNLNELRKMRTKINAIKDDINLMGDTFYDLDDPEFINYVCFLNPQSYGDKMQKYLFKKYNLKPINAHQDKGDAVDNNGIYYEIKGSLISESNKKVDIVQIRPWQKIDYYLIGIFVTNIEKIHILKLTKEEMLYECDILKASFAHGTQENLKNNENVEFRLSFGYESDVFDRWIQSYELKG